MKITELQIGDWVYVPMAKNKARIDSILSKQEAGCDVCIVIDFMGQGYLAHYKEEDIVPIPLTAEILEKNGWKNKWWWDLPECPFSLKKYCENSWADGKWGVMFNAEDNSPSFLIGGIHELQHLLRLCELNELANNLKIE